MRLDKRSVAKASTRPNIKYLGRVLRYCATFVFALFLIIGAISVVVFEKDQQALAQTPNQTLNYQSRLLLASGALVPDGNYHVEFKLYTASTPDGGETPDQGACTVNGGTPDEDCVWVETRSTGNLVRVVNGYLTVNLGSVTAFGPTIPWSQNLYLTMRVGGTSGPTWDTEMVNGTTGRMKLNSVPLAYVANNVRSANRTSTNSDDITIQTGNTTTSGNSGNISVDVGTAAGTAGTVSIATANASALTLGRSGLQTTIGGTALIQGATLSVGTTSQSGSLILSDGSGNALTIQTGSMAGDLVFTLPVTDGTSGQCLKTNGTGGLSFGDCGTGGGSSVLSGTYVAGAANVPATTTGLAVETMIFTSATAVSNTAGVAEFTAPADGSFRSCMVQSNAAITGGTLNLRWRINGVSTGSAVCSMDSTTNIETSEIIDSGVANFTAGDTIGIAFDTSSLGPANTDFTVYWTVEYTSGAAASYFEQGGNSFNATATLGTTDAYGLDIITNSTQAMSFTSAGAATLYNGLDIDAGGLSVSDGLTVVDGGLTVTTGGASITGGIDNNSGGITEAGAISGATSLSGGGALVISSGGSGDLTLDSSSNILIVADATIRRSASGTTTLDLLDASGTTTFSILNSNGTQAADLLVEGLVTANSFSGSGASLTSLNATNISSGTLSDSRLSANVVLLNQSQTFTGQPTFDEGIILGNTASATTGAIRWSGTDFEGYDGVSWVSLTGSGGGGGGPSPALTTVTKSANESLSSNTTPQNDDDLLFSVGANETWSFRIVVQANTPVTAGIVFAITAPSGSTCRVSFIDQQTASSESGLGCGVTSVALAGTGNNEVYEVVGTIESDATPGDVRLQWAQGTSNAGNTTVLAGSFINASIDGGSQVFMHGGNDFGATAVIGTLGANDFNLIANNSTVLSLTSAGDAVFSGDIISNGIISSNGALSVSTGGAVSFDLVSGSNLTWSLENSGAGVANLNLIDGDFQTGGVTRITNSGALSNVTASTDILTSGTLGITRGGTGVSATPTNGQLLIGNGTDFTLSTLTQGSGISISNSAGGITISSTAVQSIGAIDSETKSANGAVINGTTIVFQTADATNPGLVSTGTQTFAGDKTFTSTQTTGTAYTINTNNVTTGNGLVINASALTSGNAFEIVGAGSTSLIRVGNYTNDPIDDARVTIGEGGISASKPDALARDQLYVFGRINYSWNMYSQDFLSPQQTAQFTADTVAYGAVFDEATGNAGGFNVVSSAGTSGVAVLDNPTTPAAGENEWFGTNGVGVTERSLNPVFETRILGTNNVDHRIIAGFADIASGAANGADTNQAANEIFFRKNAGATVWQTVTRSASGAEVTNNTAVSTNAYHTLRIEVDNTSAEVRFVIDGVVVFTHTTGLPASGTRLGWYIGNGLSAANNRATTIDYVRVWSDDPPANLVENIVDSGLVEDSVEVSGNVEQTSSCIDDNSCQMIAVGSGSVIEDISDNDSVAINKTGQLGRLLVLQKNGEDKFVVDSSGALVINTNSSNAFVISSSNQTIFKVDSLGKIVRVGQQGQSSPVLFVLSATDQATDPIGENGASYYNNTMGRFRCYEDNKWRDCLASGAEYNILDRPLDWQNVAVELEELGATNQYRNWIDLTNAREYRVVSGINEISDVACRVEYSNDNGILWQALSENSVDLSATEVGLNRSAWSEINQQITGETLIRVTCRGQSEGMSLKVSSIKLQLR